MSLTERQLLKLQWLKDHGGKARIDRDGLVIHFDAKVDADGRVIRGGMPNTDLFCPRGLWTDWGVLLAQELVFTKHDNVLTITEKGSLWP